MAKCGNQTTMKCKRLEFAKRHWHLDWNWYFGQMTWKKSSLATPVVLQISSRYVGIIDVMGYFASTGKTHVLCPVISQKHVYCMLLCVCVIPYEGTSWRRRLRRCTWLWGCFPAGRWWGCIHGAGGTGSHTPRCRWSWCKPVDETHTSTCAHTHKHTY
jgi:hypothetical protein